MDRDVVGTGPGVVTVLVLGVGGIMLLAVSVVDVQQRRIPNSITYSAMVLCSIAAMIGVVTGHGSHAIAGAIGASAFGLLLYVPHRAQPESMGLGDVKLAVSLGFAIGWSRAEVVATLLTVGWTLAAASLIGLTMAAIAAASLGERPRAGQSVPFGPALSLAASLAIGVTLF